jgi:AraC-like DNA-binding protein
MSAPVLHFSPTRFPASIVRTRAVADFIVTETRYGANASLPCHAHEYACVVLVLRGSFQERFGAQERVGEPGMVIVRPAGESHSDRYLRAGGRCLNIELSPRWVAHVRGQLPVLDRSAAFRSSTFAMFGRRLHEELTHPDDVSPLAIESLTMSLLVDFARAEQRSTTRGPSWLQRVKERIQDDLSARVTLEDLALEVGVHPVHLATTFRRFYGITVASYLRQLRVEYACRELVGSDAPLADIALAAGFADQSHFGRTFKRAMRMTPAEYRAAVLCGDRCPQRSQRRETRRLAPPSGGAVTAEAAVTTTSG